VPEPTAAILLAAVAGVVGFFIGAVGVGGVLLIPFLVILGGQGIHAAAATALFTFLFTDSSGPTFSSAAEPSVGASRFRSARGR
jgi:uncharacterized membrane protein YfcA